jgi:hypothetical protein
MGYILDRNIRTSGESDTSEVWNEAERISGFFRDYHSHSEQLIDSLQEWGKKVRFTSCKYEQGLFDIDHQEPIELMNKGYLVYMKKHLEKEPVYQEQILTPIIEIEKSINSYVKK